MSRTRHPRGVAPDAAAESPRRILVDAVREREDRIAMVRATLDTRAWRCSPECPGWGIFDGNHATQIERCDECATAAREDGGAEWDDDDVALLPEAQAALADAIAGDWVEEEEEAHA